ncbi:MAG: helix-turn-helix domain-containing protein [Bacteroidales bacterium]|nr:helix-turn-helix domain-containing protein [Bacteroidales bacterium]MCD8395184.1 helix-turn-helix domain-containing protein [Bacteroidales bacterium]
MKEQIKFEELPQAVGHLINLVEELGNNIAKLKAEHKPQKAESDFIGIDEAVVLLHLAKSTIYTLTRQGRIPHYRPGKHLQFRRSELLKWLEDSRCSAPESPADVINRGVTHRPKSSWS